MAKLAVQLYTLREECEKDFIGTLEKVAALGFKGVEFAGFYDVPATILKEHLDRLGLVVVASHTGLEELTTGLQGVINYNRIIGNTNIICPWAEVATKEDLDKLIDQLKSVIGTIKENGMELLYHNHDHEFVKFEGEYALDTLYAAFNGELKMELDTFWVFRAGVAVTDYMKKHADKLKLVHLKDGTVDSICAVGSGDAPVDAVMRTALEMGIEWLVVENDSPSPDGITDVTKSMKYIKANQ